MHQESVDRAAHSAESTLTAIMGRLSAYTGQTMDWDKVRDAKLDLSPAKYEIGPLPTPPVPMPGKYKLV